MGAIITLLAVVTLSLLITRIATAALIFTGVSKDLARFQARSAFTGSGYTTSEAEAIMQHPVRRRIIMILMFAGSVGFVTIIASGITGFVSLDPQSRSAPFTEPIPIELQTQDGQIITGVIKPPAIQDDNPAEPPSWTAWVFGMSSSQVFTVRLLVLALGLLLLWMAARSRWVDDVLFRIISRALKRFTSLDTFDYQGLLHLGEGYAVVELVAEKDDWITGKNLAELRLGDEGVQVLGIHRVDGSFIGAPRGSTYIRQGDRISMWGQTQQIKELDTRRATREGELEHERRVREQQEVARNEPDDRAATRAS